MLRAESLRWFWWVIFGTYAAAVLVISVIPIPPVGPQFPAADKAQHILEYALFSWILMRAQRASGHPWLRAAWIAWIAAVLYGGLIEGIQACLPYRFAEWWDAAANAVGGTAGIWVSRSRAPEASRG